MIIQPPDTIVFTSYRHPLKSHYLKGEMPSVRFGFYGDELTKDNVSIDHLKAVSKGGKTELKNIVLSSKRKNQLKGNAPLKKYFDAEIVEQYLRQFIDIQFPDFDGNQYIKLVLRNIQELLKGG